MGEIFYNKYRPVKLGDVVGQDHFKQYLKNAVQQDKISHAIMLTGIRGSGKTSLARIVSTIVNCEDGPSLDYDINSPICKSIINGQCPDIHEMDIASNSSIENIRDIRSKAHNVPIMCRKRIFIIDEVHAATEKNLSVLLKTVECPPSHAMFIFATTEPNKVLDTIQSRCQRFDLKNLTITEISDRLKYICKSEGVEYDAIAINHIAQSGMGSLRDAISNLEKIVVGKKKDKIEVSDVAEYISVCDQKFFIRILSAMYKEEYSKALSLSKKEIANGLSPESIIMSILENASKIVLSKVSKSDNIYVEESVKDGWYKAAEVIPYECLKALWKTYLFISQSIKDTPRADILLDFSIIDAIDNLKKHKK